MSSAALQTAPHQPPPALASPPPLPSSSSSRQTTPSHSSPPWDAYRAHSQQPPKQSYSSQHHSSSSSSSKRPPSRKTSGKGVAPPLDLTAAIAARSAVASASASSPKSPKSARFAMPAQAPPRSSSNQQSSSARRANYPSERPTSSRQVYPDAASSSPRAEYRPTTNGSIDASSHSRRTTSSHGQSRDANARPSHSRDGSRSTAAVTSTAPTTTTTTTTTMPIRTHHAPDGNGYTRDGLDGAVRAMNAAEDRSGRDDGRSHRHATQSAKDTDAVPSPARSHPDEKRSRQEHGSSRSHHRAKFGDFVLTRTLGEGEFGKVKAGWKPGSSVEVAIKLIKRDAVGSNPVRLAKIKREVSILRGLKHPNIVKLLDMVETDRYIGIVLECASGGELFQYIADQGKGLDEYLARRMFAQLVSGVGYLHKNGIIHRDLKLENLLLDSKGNIIITDFGFANIFDPAVELTDEDENKLQDQSFVKRMGLDKVNDRGMRKGDLMQTSCGSPCYAAPELVTDDVPLYTGRKADVWSCGVILYAMLAGYLPFDDDPDNADGSNIQQLYLYINRTPLTFPETITPHARDLLRRILVPNPRKRADLFEVARHSWLSEYSHVVEFITSSTTSPGDIQNATTDGFVQSPVMTRTSSVRDAKRRQQTPPIGGLTKTQQKIDTPPDATQRTTKDAKRRTVQVEYVAPTTQTQRGSDPVQNSRESKSREKPLPSDPPVTRESYSRSNQQRAPPVSQTRASRDQRAYADNNAYTTVPPSSARPQTGGSMQSSASGLRSGVVNYGQPAPPTIADTNAQGRIQQPTSMDDSALVGRPSVSVPLKFAKVSGFHDDDNKPEAKQQLGGQFRGHKRSSTIGDISSKLLGRSGSVFGRKNKRPEIQTQAAEKPTRKYPPISLGNNAPEPGRTSMDSQASGGRRSFSLGLGKHRSGSISESVASGEKKDRRRFSSLLPASFSLKSIGLGKENGDMSSPMGSQHNVPSTYDARQEPLPRNFTAPGDSRGFLDNAADDSSTRGTGNSSPAYSHQRYRSVQLERSGGSAVPSYISRHPNHINSGSETSVDMRRPPTEPQMGTHSRAFADHGEYDTRRVGTSGTGRSPRGVLQKNKRFVDTYEQGHDGSSAAAKRVMDFFRRRGKTRSGEEQ